MCQRLNSMAGRSLHGSTCPNHGVARRAFTLVELLVVISVIALLVALLLPTLAKALDSAKAVQCATNLRSLGQAHLLYVNDNKGRFTYAGYPTGGAATTATTPDIPDTIFDDVTWDDLLGLGGYDGRSLTMAYANQTSLRYVAGNPSLDPPDRDLINRLYSCPSYGRPLNFLTDRFLRIYRINSAGNVDKRISPAQTTLGIFDTNVNGNRFLRGIASSAWSRSDSSVPDPARTILLTEGDYGTSNNYMGAISGTTLVTPYQQEGWWNVGGGFFKVPAFHSNQSAWNYAFVDGSVNLLSPHATFGTGTFGGPSIDGLSAAARDDRGARGMWTAATGD